MGSLWSDWRPLGVVQYSKVIFAIQIFAQYSCITVLYSRFVGNIADGFCKYYYITHVSLVAVPASVPYPPGLSWDSTSGVDLGLVTIRQLVDISHKNTHYLLYFVWVLAVGILPAPSVLYAATSPVRPFWRGSVRLP